MAGWAADEPGVLVLPSGRTVRGGSARRPPAATADFTLHLLTFRPRAPVVDGTWIRWPDFGVPADESEAFSALLHVWTRSEHLRVDVRCRGGRGRTGTALACIAVLDGLDPPAALELVRSRYDGRAVETPWQKGVTSRIHERRRAGR